MKTIIKLILLVFFVGVNLISCTESDISEEESTSTVNMPGGEGDVKEKPDD